MIGSNMFARASIFVLFSAFSLLIVQALERTQLHVHLDGAVSAQTLFEIAQSRNLSLPLVGRPKSVRAVELLIAANVSYFSFARRRGSRNSRFSFQFGFKAFDVVNNIIGGDESALEAAAFAFVKTQADQNVTYVEVRYDPSRAARSSYVTGNVSISLEDAVHAIQRGLARGLELSPPVSAYQLLCAMRDQPAAKCFEVADLAARLHSNEPGGVVGMDLAGNEWTKLTNTLEYVPCFRRAKELGLNTTVHVGETLPWPLHSQTAADVWIAAVEMGCVFQTLIRPPKVKNLTHTLLSPLLSSPLLSSLLLLLSPPHTSPSSSTTTEWIGSAMDTLWRSPQRALTQPLWMLCGAAAFI